MNQPLQNMDMPSAVSFYLHKCGLDKSSPYAKWGLAPFSGLCPWLGLAEVFPVFLQSLENRNQFPQGNG